MNYYERLNINSNASSEEINISFRKLAKMYHPDINKGVDAQKIFIEIYEAYSILKDVHKRNIYDKTIKTSDATNEVKNDYNNWRNDARKEGKQYSETKYEDIEKYWDLFDYGHDLYVKKQYNQAIEYFNKSLSYKKDQAVYFFRGCAYEDLGNYNLAVNDFTSAINIEPNNSIYLYFRGTLYIKLNKDDLAFNDFTKCIEIDGYPDAYKDRGNIYIRRGKIDLAIQDYKCGIKMDQKNARIYFNLAVAYNDYKKDYNNAILTYTFALQYDPKMAEAYNNRGNVYYNKSDYDEAISDFTKAIQLGNYLAYFNRGNAYYLTKRYNEAINDYNEAIKINPNNSTAYNNRGAAYKAKGNFIKSKIDFVKARSLGEK
jgi:tetratricopeptide (TPR) repeat protein